MVKIRNADDFELGFNCMARLYMRQFDEEILVDMIKLCDEYLKWLDHRTIVCALRDLIREYPFGWNDEPIPKNQVERFENLIKVLMKQGICTERQASHYRNEYDVIRSFSGLIGVNGSRWGKEKGFDDDSFYQWVLDNSLNEIVGIKEIKNNMLPLKKKFIPMFYKVCKYMIRYSYGRHTYMPSTCRDFVKANMVVISDEVLQDIVDYLKKKNASIPPDERAIDKIDSDNWIEMQEDLEAELLSRHMFYKAQEKDGNVQELTMLLNELLDLESLHTQKECLHMYYQLRGIERYLVSISDDLKVKSLLRYVELAKKEICEKRMIFFEKEEGHLYQKIGDGVWQRKKTTC